MLCVYIVVYKYMCTRYGTVRYVLAVCWHSAGPMTGLLDCPCRRSASCSSVLATMHTVQHSIVPVPSFPCVLVEVHVPSYGTRTGGAGAINPLFKWSRMSPGGRRSMFTHRRGWWAWWGRIRCSPLIVEAILSESVCLPIVRITSQQD